MKRIRSTKGGGGKRSKNDDKDALSKAAAILGRLGGLKGGKARAEKLSATERSEIARDAANARWKVEREKG